MILPWDCAFNALELWQRFAIATGIGMLVSFLVGLASYLIYVYIFCGRGKT